MTGCPAYQTLKTLYQDQLDKLTGICIKEVCFCCVVSHPARDSTPCFTLHGTALRNSPTWIILNKTFPCVCLLQNYCCYARQHNILFQLVVLQKKLKKKRKKKRLQKAKEETTSVNKSNIVLLLEQNMEHSNPCTYHR